MFSQKYGVRLIGHAGNTTGFSANLVLGRESRTETGFTYDDLSGIYCNSRANYLKRFMKLFSMISGLLPVTKGGYMKKEICRINDGKWLKAFAEVLRNTLA